MFFIFFFFFSLKTKTSGYGLDLSTEECNPKNCALLAQKRTFRISFMCAVNASVECEKKTKNFYYEKH